MVPSEKFAVSTGFANVREDHVTVLAETCEEPQEIDVAHAAESQKVAEGVMGGAMSEEEFKKQKAIVQLSIVRQKIADR